MCVDDITTLHTNQKVLLNALIRQGAKVDVIDEGNEVVRIIYNNKETYLLDRFTEAVPYNWVVLTASKIFVKNLLLDHDISAPLGDIFSGNSINIIKPYVEKLGYPVVLKPDWGSHGDNVFIRLQDYKQLHKAINCFMENEGANTQFIVEEYFQGFEHRIFITQKGDYAILKREPAHVVGDGLNTIKQLVKSENKRRAGLKKTADSSLCPIVIDEHVKKYLKEKEKSLEYIPSKDEKVYLRLTSNIAKGGVSHNLTAEAHPSVIEIAKKVASIIPLPFMGIDFITEDISKPQNYDSYRILEVNSSPGFAMHMLPAIGEHIDVGEYAVKVLF